MDIRSYLAEGEELERESSPAPWIEGHWGGQCHIDHGGWHPGPSECKYDAELFRGFGNIALASEGDHVIYGDDPFCNPWDSAFIVDARERLPRYRKALEAVVEICEANNDSRSWVYDIIAGAVEQALSDPSPVDSTSKLCYPV